METNYLNANDFKASHYRISQPYIRKSRFRHFVNSQINCSLHITNLYYEITDRLMGYFPFSGSALLRKFKFILLACYTR